MNNKLKKCDYCKTEKDNVSDMLSNGYHVCDDCADSFGWNKPLETMREAKEKKAIENRLNSFNNGNVIITKDNIHLYYEFMSDDVLKYIDILHPIFCNHYHAIVSYFKKIGFIVDDGKGYDYDKVHYKGSFIKRDITMYYGISFFGIKDTLKPIDEYIADIKASEEYKAYAA